MTSSMPFKDSELLGDAGVQKAYALVSHIPRAVGSALIMSEMMPVAENIAGHLLAFVTPQISLATIKREYGEEAADTVKHIRKYNDEKGDLLKLKCNAAIEASFIACGLWDAEKTLALCKGKSLSTGFLSVSGKGDSWAMISSTAEDILRDARRRIENPYLIMARLNCHPPVLERVRQTLKQIDVMIATLPEEMPAPARASAPKPKR